MRRRAYSTKDLGGPIVLLSLLFALSAVAAPDDNIEDADSTAGGHSAPAKDGDVSGERTDTPASQGLDPFTTGAIQIATGCGLELLSVPLSVTTCGVYGCLVHPAVAAYAETWVGDHFGQKRGVAIYPMVAKYAFGLASAAATFAMPLVFPVAPSTSNDLFTALQQTYSQPNQWIATGTGLALTAVGVILIPLVYNFTAEDKKPGDDGSGQPGMFAPAHRASGTASLPPPAARGEFAMAY